MLSDDRLGTIGGGTVSLVKLCKTCRGVETARGML
jgi:hypothetical protein